MTLIRALLYPARLGVRLSRRLRLLASAGEHDFAQAARVRLRRYRASATPICLVSHDAHRHGAQLLLLELARIFARVFGLDLHIVVLGPGPLNWRFRKYGHVHQLTSQTGQEAEALAQRLATRGVQQALCNSTATGLFCETLTTAGIRCVALVHELPKLIHDRRLTPHADAIRRSAALTIFPSDLVRQRFPGGAPSAACVLPQGLPRRRGAPDASRRGSARAFLQQRYGIPADAPLVLNTGYGDLRKGIDLFVDIGIRTMAHDPRVRFLWVGGIEPERRERITTSIATSGFAGRFIFAPFERELAPYFDGADIFALTSREDPFPTVLLQALDAGLPSLAFAGAGGFEMLLRQGAGVLVGTGDTDAFASALLNLLRVPRQRVEMRACAIGMAETFLSLRQYAFELAALIGAAPPRVSVVVPNYNYARYLPARLRSIFRQTLPVYETIMLDDCSTDDSLAVVAEVVSSTDVDARVIEGIHKSPSVFEQWRRGVEAARGELIWIAEADDLCDEAFLETVTLALRDPEITLSYCQSRQIDHAGRVLDSDYLTYVSKIDDSRWRAPYEGSGIEEIRNALAVKNTIPNVSACVFRREPLLKTLERHSSEISRYTIAGDWIVYIRALAHGKIAYDPRPLNRHRRHQRSVTASALTNAQALAEIETIQKTVQAEFDVPPPTKAIADAYLDELRTQFGLAP